jgi:hypothetical protein
MTRGFELRALEIARPRIEGTRSENASRSRRVTTTADFRAMREERTPPRRRDNYGDSPVPRSSVPIASALL